MATRAEIIRAESRRSKVAALLAQGVTAHYEISQRLGLDGDSGRRLIGLDIEIIRAQWLAMRTAHADVHIAAALAKVDLLERAYWEAFDRSCREREATRTHKRNKDLNSEVEVRKEKRDGNAKFLDGVRSCIRLRLEMLGLLKQEAAASLTVVTVVGGIDLQVVTGDKPGLPGRIEERPHD